ncbi:serine hydrolase domain-containing protein [Nocardioides coralli]|uniref:serine hydrolase domain-containing protein n=1 Tax=Nocardioides coralli TaxID=2872154 RepID=UPI001CA4160A|nr:serine hydrolase domain-containing protein [Nocardioides coralli]QZY29250.1 serine hydrolase [Nocardioides coralli]
MRRTLLAVVSTLGLVAATGAAATGARPQEPGPERSERPALAGTLTTSAATAAADDEDRPPHHRLRHGSPREADLVPRHLDQVGTSLRRFLEPSPDHPLYAGGVVLAARHGVVAVHEAAGDAVRYTDRDTELPPQDRVAARRDTIYDLASVTKTFTTIAVMQQVESGAVDLDEPVATYLPDFAAEGKASVTVRHLLTHTGGLPAWVPLYRRHDTVAERRAAVLAAKPTAPPGTAYVYSDLGMITLGMLVEEVTGRGLDAVVADGITRPLGMTDTMFDPPESLRHRIAATEEQPWAGRPMIRGEVHDENAWSLGGVAGHAGLFSTAHDLALLAQTLLNGGRHGRARILEEETVEAMLTDENTEFPGDSHGLGFELDQRWYMDAMSSPSTFGHTGFTGTSLVIDPVADTFVVLLTNRVHPTRDRGSNNPARRAVAQGVARAVAVSPRHGRTAWFSGLGDARTATLTTTVDPEGARRMAVGFDLWYDTEAGRDVARLELSDDGGETWRAVPFHLWSGGSVTPTDGEVSGYGGRVWHHAVALVDVTDGEQRLRWTYTTDSRYQGRGVYVDGVRVMGPDGERLDSTGFSADGWSPSRD